MSQSHSGLTLEFTGPLRRVGRRSLLKASMKRLPAFSLASVEHKFFTPLLPELSFFGDSEVTSSSALMVSTA